MTNNQILFVARGGQILTVLFFALTIVATINPGTFGFPKWLDITLFLTCITAPLIICLKMLGEYRPFTRKRASSDMLINWKNFSVMGIIGTILLSILCISIFDAIYHKGITGIVCVLIFLIGFIEYFCVQTWLEEMSFRGERV